MSSKWNQCWLPAPHVLVHLFCNEYQEPIHDFIKSCLVYMYNINTALFWFWLTFAAAVVVYFYIKTTLKVWALWNRYVFMHKRNVKRGLNVKELQLICNSYLNTKSGHDLIILAAFCSAWELPPRWCRPPSPSPPPSTTWCGREGCQRGWRD